MKTPKPDIESLIKQAMQKTGERFANERDLLTHVIGNFISQTETKEERLRRTQSEFEGILEECLAVPLSEYQPLNIDAIEAEYSSKRN